MKEVQAFMRWLADQIFGCGIDKTVFYLPIILILNTEMYYNCCCSAYFNDNIKQNAFEH